MHPIPNLTFEVNTMQLHKTNNIKKADELTDEEMRALEHSQLNFPIIHFPQMDSMDEFEDPEISCGENTEVDAAAERAEI